MTGTSSFAPLAAVYALGYPMTKKLSRNNHPLWKTQVQSAIKGVQVGHFLDASVQPPLKTVPVSKEKPNEMVDNTEYEA
jgi:hypothetical protein